MIRVTHREEVNIEDEEFWTRLANLLYRVKQYKLALRCYENAIQQHPKAVTETYSEKAQAYQARGEIDQAILAYKEALDSASDNTRNRQPFKIFQLLLLSFVVFGLFFIASKKSLMPLIDRVKSASHYLKQKKPWIPIAGRMPLWIIPLLLSLLFFNIKGVITSPDSSWYIAHGLNLHLGRGYVDAGWLLVTLRGPIFPGLIALFFGLFGASIKSALWAVRFFYVLNVCLVYAIGSKLFNRAAGFIAALLVLSSYTVHKLSSVILLDHIMPFFILLSQLLLYMAFKDKKKFLFVLSGIVFGIAFLTKDMAVLILPLPVLLWVFVPSFREGKSWQGVLLFYGAALAIIASWYGYVYTVSNGKILALNTAEGNIRTILSISEKGNGASKSTPFIGLRKWLSSLWRSLVTYYKGFLAKNFTLAPLFLVAWIYVGYKACVKRTRSAIMLGASLLLFAPLIILLGRSSLRAGQSFYLYLISYLALAGMLWAVVSDHPRSQIRRAIGVTIVLVALAVQVWVGNVGFINVIKKGEIFSLNYFNDNLIVKGWHDNDVKTAAEWLTENANANEPILFFHWEWRASLYFFLNGRQPIYQYPVNTIWKKILPVIPAKPANIDGTYLFIWTEKGDARPNAKLKVLLESELISQIHEKGIKYIIVTSRLNFFSIYLKSNPGFEEVANIGNGKIKIFKVKNTISPIPFYTHFEQNIPEYLKQFEIIYPQRYQYLEDYFIEQLGWTRTQVKKLINGDIHWYESFKVKQTYIRGIIEISESMVDIPLHTFEGNPGVVVGKSITFLRNGITTSSPLLIEPGSYSLNLYGYGTSGQRDENDKYRTPFIDVVVLKDEDPVSRQTVRLWKGEIIREGPVFTIEEPAEVSIQLAYADDAGGARKVHLSGVYFEEVELPEGVFEVPIRSFDAYRDMTLEEWISRISRGGEIIYMGENIKMTSEPVDLKPGSYNVKLSGYGTKGQRDENDEKRTPYIDVVVIKDEQPISRKTVRLWKEELIREGPVFTISEPGEVAVQLVFADDAGGARKVYLSEVYFEEVELPEGVFEIPIRSFDAYRDMPPEEWISNLYTRGETVFMGKNTTMTSAPVYLEPGSYSVKLYGYGTKGQQDENDEKRTPFIEVVVLKDEHLLSRQTVRLWKEEIMRDGPVFTIAEPGEVSVHLVYVDDAGGARKVFLSGLYFEEVELPEGVFEVPIRSFDTYRDMPPEEWISILSTGGETVFMGENTTMTSAPIDLGPGSYRVKLYGSGTKGQRDENDEKRTPYIDVVVLKDKYQISRKTVRLWKEELPRDGPVFTIAKPGEVSVHLIYADDAGGARKVYLTGVYFEEIELPEGIFEVPIRSFDAYREMPLEDWISNLHTGSETMLMGENITMTSAPVDLEPGSYSVTLSGYGTMGQQDENDEYRPPFIDIIALEGEDPVSRKTILLWENMQTRDGPVFTIAEPGEVSVRIVYADDAGGARKVYLSEVYFEEVELPEGVFEIPLRSFDAYRDMPLEDWFSKLYWEGEVIFMGENTTITSAPIDLEPGSYSVNIYGYGTKGQQDENDEDRTPYIEVVVLKGEDPISRKIIRLLETSENRDGPVFTIAEPGEVSVHLIYSDDAGGARKVFLSRIYIEAWNDESRLRHR